MVVTATTLASHDGNKKILGLEPCNQNDLSHIDKIEDNHASNNVDEPALQTVSISFIRNYNIEDYNIKFRIEDEKELDEEGQLIKCSAVHTLERDMPTFNYAHLVGELRAKILADHEARPGLYAQLDLDKCKQDSWFVARFLLRYKLNVDEAFETMSKALRFNNESSILTTGGDFPAEFYQIGGMFTYETDRKGNTLLFIRGKIHRKVPEVQAVLQSFIYKLIKDADNQANGRGIAVVIDCTGAGIINADMDSLLFFVSTLRNYFPKGLSYILVHELPWILRPFWLIAKNWISDEQAQLIKFSNSKTIFEYIQRQKLPDFMGGTCEKPYNVAPDNCPQLEQASKLWGITPETVKKILQRYSEFLPEGSVDKLSN